MNASKRAEPTIGVIGIGNRLMGDEGLGVEAVQAMGRRGLPEGVELVDGGTDPWSALSSAEDCRCLILLDAILGGGEPGSLYRLGLEEVDVGSRVLSLHGVTLFHLLNYERLLGNEFDEVVVLGMEPQRVEPGIGLSERCRQALEDFVRMAEQEILRLSTA